MYRLSPYTYLIEGLLGQALGRQDINCSPVEFVQLTPPSGETCQSYMENFISFAGGYLSNPEATDACNYCSSRTTDQFLINSFNIFYEHHWRNLGFMVAFTAFNVSLPHCFCCQLVIDSLNRSQPSLVSLIYLEFVLALSSTLRSRRRTRGSLQRISRTLFHSFAYSSIPAYSFMFIHFLYYFSLVFNPHD